SAFITGKMADSLTASMGIFNTFRTLGIIFLILIVVLSMFLVFPPAGWCPSGWKPPVAAAGAPKSEFTRNEMTKTKTFMGLWVCYVIGALAGLMAIGVAKPAGLEIAANANMEVVAAGVLMTNLVLPFAF